MSQKLGWAFGAALGGWILAAFNYSKDLADKHLPQAAETVFGEQLMLSIFPAICALLAAVAMFFYPLTEKKVREVTEALQAKRAA
jgi:GPH family glycoside/pentoside/hexuronide:cation symporter